MKGTIAGRTLLEPRSVDDALGMLAGEENAMPMAGCTDLYVSLNFGTLAANRFVNLWGLRELRGIRVEDDSLVIGALTTYTDLIRSPLVSARLPMLVSAAREVGGVQVQCRGTIGGNIANGSPAGDTLPVLAAAEAVLQLRSRGAAREIPFGDFFTGYRATVMRRDEIISAIRVPPVEGRQWFRKVGTRAAQAISKIVMAAVRAPRPRIALGSVAPTVVRLSGTERALAQGESLEAARAVLENEIRPIDDLRSTAVYRRAVAGNLLERFWSDTG
ncbi:MAG: xanthine dehydrogenase family protein subunit M [Gemmatimonadota bacterium]|nr:xanthine dehydrogenase family protein subunit M [Gemmatimonadota bacterium]